MNGKPQGPQQSQKSSNQPEVHDTSRHPTRYQLNSTPFKLPLSLERARSEKNSSVITQEKHPRSATLKTQTGLIKDQASKKRAYEEIGDGEQHAVDHSNKNHLEEEKKGADLNQEAVLLCIICVEDLKEKKAIIDCGHAFCRECIQKWATIENTCPFCKQEFTKITEKRIGKSLGLYKRRPKMHHAPGRGAQRKS